jgi:pilus assembly protein CpaB
MRSRMLIVAVVALGLALGITFFIYRLLQSRMNPAEEPTTAVVVASADIPLGTRLSKDNVKLAKWPKANPIEGGFSDIEEVIDRANMIPIQMNEPILESKLAPKEAGAGLTAVIPEGMRALSIQVNNIIGVAGFVIPGSHVDLILIGTPPSEVEGARSGQPASKIILENLEVIAAGQNVQRSVDGKPQTVQVVTLLVTPEQAQRVSLATGEGRIQLALRNPMDEEAVAPPMVVQAQLYTGETMEGAVKEPAPPQPVHKRPAPAGVAPAAPQLVAKAPEPRIVVVEVIRGANRSSQTFEKVEE